jgi:hypothetical protein
VNLADEQGFAMAEYNWNRGLQSGVDMCMGGSVYTCPGSNLV